MTSHLVAFSLVALAVSAHADPRETRKVGAFDAVDVQGMMEVDVEIGAGTSVVVEGPADLARLVTTKVEGSTLVIDTPDDFSQRLKGRGDTDLKVIVRTPALGKVTISGTAEVEVEGLRNKTLDATIRGTGELDLEGRTELLRLDVSGTGQVKAKELVASAVELSVNGTAQAVVHASKSFEGNVRGTAAVKVLGKPATVKKNIAGTAVIDVK